MLWKLSKKEGLTQCRHFFFLLFFIPLFFSFFSFIFACLLVYKSLHLFLFFFFFFFHFFIFLLASKSFHSFFTFWLVSKFYYKSMSTIFYHKFNVQSNSNKKSTKNFKKSLYWKFQEIFYFYFNANLYLLCCENSMSKVVWRKILSLLQVQNLYLTFNCKVLT